MRPTAPQPVWLWTCGNCHTEWSEPYCDGCSANLMANPPDVSRPDTTRGFAALPIPFFERAGSQTIVAMRASRPGKEQ